MTWIKKYPILSLLLIAGILFMLIHFFNSKRERREENEMTKSNTLRRLHNVPIIERNWIKNSIELTKEKWSDGIKGRDTSLPVHLYKDIYHNNGIDLEEDAFHFEIVDTLQYRLILNHRYVQNDSVFVRTANRLIYYQLGKLPPSYSKELSNESADSVLHAWKIEIN